MKTYLILDRSGRLLFEQPAFTALEARNDARERSPNAVTAMLKTLFSARLVGVEAPINNLGLAFRNRL